MIRQIFNTNNLDYQTFKKFMSEIKLGKYLHYKGKEYEVLGLAKHSETLEELVVYKHLDDSSLWVRPLKMFEEFVEVSGELIPRFKFLGK